MGGAEGAVMGGAEEVVRGGGEGEVVGEPNLCIAALPFTLTLAPFTFFKYSSSHSKWPQFRITRTPYSCCSVVSLLPRAMPTASPPPHWLASSCELPAPPAAPSPPTTATPAASPSGPPGTPASSAVPILFA